MKRAKRGWKILGIAVGLIVVCLVGLQIAISPLAEKIVSEKVMPFFGGQLKIGSIGISIFRGSVIIKDVELLQPPGFDNNDFLQTKAIKAQISILPLLKKQLVIKEITILQPEVNLVQLKNGETNTTYYLSMIKNSSTPSTSPLNFHLNRLSIQKGKIALYSYKMTSKQPTFLVKNLNFDLKNINIPNDKNIPSPFNINGVITSSNPATIKSNGEGIFFGGPISFKAKTTIDKVSLGDFSYLYPDTPIIIQEGQMWIEADAECKGNYLVSKQHIEIKNLKIDSKGGFIKKTFLGLPAKGFVQFLEDKNGSLDFDFEIAGNLDNLKVNTKEAIGQAVAKSVKEKIGPSIIESAEKLGEGLKKTGEETGKSIKNIFKRER